jgi:hypothetical protein
MTSRVFMVFNRRKTLEFPWASGLNYGSIL